MMRHIRSELTGKSSAYSTTETGIIVRKNPKTGNLQVVVPKHLQEIMCYLHHNLPLSAHQGAKRALAALTRSYYWPGIRTFVRKFVKCCSCCTRRKENRKENAGLSIAQLAKRSGQIIQIDIYGPLPES